VLCLLVCVVVGLDAAPSKLSLGTTFVNLPSQKMPPAMTYAHIAPIKSLGLQTLPSETLPAQQGSVLQTQTLPQLFSETFETLPEQTLEPLQAQKMPPQYRQQDINQQIVQPIYKTQPVLQVRHVTQTVYQPTLQKQPVIQRVITQPVLHRVIHNQPIIQQQLQQQTVVKRRVIAQPRVVQRLETQYSTAPKQTRTEFGQQYPTVTQTNPKVAAIQQHADPNPQTMASADPADPAHPADNAAEYEAQESTQE
jgi:hypothetical protein